MINKWNLLSAEIKYQKKWLTVYEQEVQLPDGRILSPYLVIHVPSFCNVFIVTEKEEVVLVKQYRQAAGIVSIELPGGMVDPGEEPMNAALREMEEETGFSTNDMELLYTIHPNPPLENNQAWFYLAKNAKQVKNIQLDPFEDIELLKFSKQQFMEMLLTHSFTHGSQIGAMYAAVCKLGWLVAE